MVAFILDIISSLVILLSIGIIAAFCLDMKDILLATSYFVPDLKEIGAFYLFIPSTILSMIAGILFYYLCISIGNLFNTNKVLMDCRLFSPFRLSYSLLVSSLDSVQP